MSKHNINNYVWVVIWTADGEVFAEYFNTEAEADDFIRSRSCS